MLLYVYRKTWYEEIAAQELPLPGALFFAGFVVIYSRFVVRYALLVGYRRAAVVLYMLMWNGLDDRSRHFPDVDSD